MQRLLTRLKSLDLRDHVLAGTIAHLVPALVVGNESSRFLERQGYAISRRQADGHALGGRAVQLDAIVAFGQVDGRVRAERSAGDLGAAFVYAVGRCHRLRERRL